MARTDTMSTTPVTMFLMGSLLGVAAGLLFAPRSGRENREMLKQTARDNYEKMQAKARQGREAATTAVDGAVDTTKDIITLTQETAEDAKERLDAAKPGKRPAL